ncbi:flagellar hook-associated protein FlgL [Bacillus shivajii]|uniref:flagellar hook-associated protein FlgL n=1 Tax=Bacillus shivajii TaxID=1983719 RepID=UPI001CF9DD59|nr:flagellar hook-associated protein FlgL [Bacillus shivajii]UCZ52694.1 flagellar hook-associated protein FlgL [Bacillus shivajii]
MRVTQSMLTNNSLRHLNQSYEGMKNLQDQLSTGKKISRASQDPVVAMNGMRYRTQVTEVEQFKRNLSEVYNWMDTSDSTLDETTQAMHRIRELTVQASNDTYEGTQRANIGKEVAQLREHLQSLANTQANNKYIFNGTNTTNPPVREELLDVKLDGFKDQMGEFDPDEAGEFPLEISHNSARYTLNPVDQAGPEYTFTHVDENVEKSITVNADSNQITFINNEGDETEETSLKERQVVFSHVDAVSTNAQNVEIELLKGVNVPVNVDAGEIFSNDFFGDIIQLEKALEDPNASAQELTQMLDRLDHQMNKIVDERAELGARQNRVEMIDDRVQEQEVISKRILSDNEDADIEKVITELMMQENVHRAALSASSRIIQPSLIDFLR